MSKKKSKIKNNNDDNNDLKDYLEIQIFQTIKKNQKMK